MLLWSLYDDIHMCANHILVNQQINNDKVDNLKHFLPDLSYKMASSREILYALLNVKLFVNDLATCFHKTAGMN